MGISRSTSLPYQARNRVCPVRESPAARRQSSSADRHLKRSPAGTAAGNVNIHGDVFVHARTRRCTFLDRRRSRTLIAITYFGSGIWSYSRAIIGIIVLVTVPETIIKSAWCATCGKTKRRIGHVEPA